MPANTWVDHLRKLIQSKDICQLRRTGLHTHFEWTSGHTVPRKEALCLPNTHFHHLPYAGFSTYVNQSQFSANSVSWCSSTWRHMNTAATECGTTSEWGFFHCQPRLMWWQYLQRNTRRFGQEKDLLSFQQKQWCASQEWCARIYTTNTATGALKRSASEHSRCQCNSSDQVLISGVYPKHQSRYHSYLACILE